MEMITPTKEYWGLDSSQIFMTKKMIIRLLGGDGALDHCLDRLRQVHAVDN